MALPTGWGLDLPGWHVSAKIASQMPPGAHVTLSESFRGLRRLYLSIPRRLPAVSLVTLLLEIGVSSAFCETSMIFRFVELFDFHAFS